MDEAPPVAGAAGAREWGARTRFRALFDLPGVACWEVALDGVVIAANEATIDICGRDPVGLPSTDLVHPDDHAVLEELLSQALSAPTIAGAIRLVRPDGTTRQIIASAAVTFDDGGRPCSLLGASVEITERIRADERLRALVEQSADVITVITAKGDVVFQSEPSRTPLWGMRAVGTELFATLHPDDAAKARIAMARILEHPNERIELEVRASAPTGGWRILRCRATNHLANPAIAGIVVTAHDVTEQRATEASLWLSRHHDPLTDLPNRVLLEDRVKQMTARAERVGTAAAVLYIDLDRFADLKDVLGDVAGDEVIRAVAELLGAHLRQDDTLARLEGNVFAVLLEVDDRFDATELGRRVAQALAAGVRAAGQTFDLTASIGVAFADTADRADDVVARAASAAHRAKRSGGGRWELFDAALHEQAVARLKADSHLRTAIGAGELELWFVPVVDLVDGRVSGLDAVVHWRQPGGDVLPASSFLPFVENGSVLVEVGEWTIGQACATAARLRHALPEHPVIVSVRVVARQIADPGLVAATRRALARTGVDPGAISLEIDERALSSDSDRVLHTLRSLRAAGVHLGVGGFGAGHTSLALLKRCPIEYMKVDQSFVATMTTEIADLQIIRTLTHLASGLGMDVVAPGVDTPAHLDLVASLGCRYAQGALWGPAVPEDLLVGVVADPVARHTVLPAGELPAPYPAADEAVAVLVHELATPLTVASGFLDIAEEAILNDGNMALGALAAIRRSLSSIEQIVGSLVDLRSLESGTLTLRLEPVDLHQLARRIVDDLSAVLSEHVVELAPHGAPRPALVSADPSRLQQVVVNLLANAAKFSPRGETITVATSTTEHEALLTVVDSGAGVDTADVGRIFRKFARSVDEVGGAGLGLFLSRGIVRSHGGELSYRRAPTGGAEFRITLPLVAATAAGGHPSPRAFEDNR